MANASEGECGRVLDLLEQMFSGSLDAAGRAELDALIRASPDAAALYVEQSDLHAMLQWEHGTAKPTSADEMSERMLLDDLFSQAVEQRRLHELEFEAQQQLTTDQQSQRRLHDLASRRERSRLREAESRPRVFSNTAIWLGVAALVGLAVWIGRATHGPSAPAPGPPPMVDHGGHERTNPLFDAMLRADVDARWASANLRPELNAPVGDQVYELVSGLARFEMGQGAIVVVEGPARVRVIGPNRLHLESGRLTADVPSASTGFTVTTPTAEVMNDGTSFGVESRAGLGTFAHVYSGQVLVAPLHPSSIRSALPLQVRANHAAWVDADGKAVAAASADAVRFVQHGTFDALAGGRGQQAQADAVRAMWERDPTLVAAHVFDDSHPGLAYGWLGGFQVLSGRYGLAEDSLVRSGQEADFGGRMTFAPMSSDCTVFLDLDLRRGQPAERAGLLVSPGGAIGRDGTRVCIAWSMRLERGNPGESGWCGLSLFDGGVDKFKSEMAFFGKCSESSVWGAQFQRIASGEPQWSPERLLASRETIEPRRVYRWLVVIDFQRGRDRVSVYLDPEPGRLGEPFAVFTEADLTFDRLRLESSNNGCDWSFDDLRLGTEVGTCLSN